MNASLLQELELKGVVLSHPFCDDGLIERTLQEVSGAFASANPIRVNADDIVIRTFNGDQLLALCPSVGEVYQFTLDSVRRQVPDIKELEDRTIGISSNYLRRGSDKFRMHFDRNQLTVVIYLNDLDALPLVLYPNVRRDPIQTGVKDRFELAGLEPQVVFPKRNLAVTFFGRRTFHAINPATTTSGNSGDRYSLQFAFDFDSFDYRDEQYYGKTS